MAMFELPQRVQESIERRARAGARTRVCVYDDCPEPAARARGGRAARCLEHDAQEFPAPVIPDPTRTLSGLRAAAGLRAEAFSVGRTVLDTRAEAKGQRVSSARRAAARGDAR